MKISNNLQIRYKATIWLIRECKDASLPNKEVRDFESFEDVLDWVDGDDGADITLEVFSPNSKQWESVLFFPARIAREVETL